MRRTGMKSDRRPITRCFTALRTVLAAMTAISPGMALANPVGPVVVNGQAMVSGLGTPIVTIQQNTSKVILNWQSFNIAPGELTRFLQPSARAMALNRILDQNPSQIFGSLQANGIVLLLNPNGVLFGPNAQVNVNGLVASSLNLTDSDFLNGIYNFQQSGIAGAVNNAGSIHTDTGGFVYLFAPNVENTGVITSPEGQIYLAAGSTVYLTDRPDGQGFLVKVQAPAGTASNLKDLIADGGAVDLYGQVVNQSGLIQANSVRQHNGQIELVASEQVNLTAGSLIEAKGDTTGISNGGTVKVTSDQGTTKFESGAVIDVSGGAAGGNGGSVELSGQSVQLGGQVIGHAVDRYQGGSLLIDPDNLTVGQDDLLNLLNNGLTSIAFQANQDLTIDGVNVDLSNFPVSGRGSISFTAGGDLQINNTYLVNDPGGGKAFTGTVRPWDLTVTAGNDVILDNSFFGTGSGGNLTVTAGRDVISPSVWDPLQQRYTGFRLDGVRPGTLTIDAGRDFVGGFVLTSGTADVTVGRNFGLSADPVTGLPDYVDLTLGMGKISVDAGGDIYLGLVQDAVLAEGRGKLRGGKAGFLNLADPGNSVTLLSDTGSIYLQPISTNQNQVDNTLQFYPASFSAQAPEGSIVIGSDLTFWPSQTGSVIFSAQNDIMGVIQQGVIQQDGQVIQQDGQVPVIRFVQADPGTLSKASGGTLDRLLSVPAPSAPVMMASLAPVVFKTDLGDIHDLILDLQSPSSLPKSVTISSGHDLTSFATLLSAYQCVDGDCPQIVSAANNIDMTKPQGASVVSGVTFFGNGHGEVLAGENLDLATSSGIQFFQGSATSPGGLLDVGVGKNLEMTLSKIVTYNGGSISIHGPGGADTPVGGRVDVGTNVRPANDVFGDIFGIVTLAGGAITILADGTVNVDQSRVATLSGGDITIESVHGDINAGSGARNELVEFPIQVLDANGNPVIDPVTHEPVYQIIYVPGSGIFTFAPGDPNPLPSYPAPPPVTAFMTPAGKALAALVLKQVIAGHEISAGLYAQYQAALQIAAKAWGNAYTEIVNQFTADWQLGDIRLTAPEGSVVVPKAGIRGKNITIKAKNLDLQGGTIVGNLNIDVGNVSGNQHAIVGPTFGNLGGSFAVPAPTSSSGLSGLTGSTGSLSSTVTAMTTTAVAEVVQDQATAPAQADTGGASDKQGASAKKKMRTVRLKQGVTIEVEVKEEKP